MSPRSRASILIAAILSLSQSTNGFVFFPSKIRSRSSSVIPIDSTVSITSVGLFPWFSFSKEPSESSSQKPAASPPKSESPKDDEEIELSRKNFPPPITHVEKMDDFLNFLGEDDRLCIVKFYASWCKSCQKFDVRYRKLAYEVGDQTSPGGEFFSRGKVRFADVEFSQNANLCQTLGIKRLPYIHLYRGADGRLEEFVCTSKNFQTLVDKMNEHLLEEEKTFEEVMEDGEKLGSYIATQLKDDHYEEVMNKDVAHMNNTRS